MDPDPNTHRRDDSIRIGLYQDWMFQQAVDLFVSEYGGDRDTREELFSTFYEHPFQRDRGIRLVALDGDRVCGFQSYFFWPYVFCGKELRTYQSGKSLVHPDYRGRGIFARLLGFLDDYSSVNGIDLLMGFPVEMSFGSFLRNGWTNPLDLSWYGKILRPLSLIRAKRPLSSDFEFEARPADVEAFHAENHFSLSRSSEFAAWRDNYASSLGDHRFFTFEHSGRVVSFGLKSGRRGRINELVIGDVIRDSGDPQLLAAGLRALVRAARQHSFLTVLTIACNASSTDRSLTDGLRRAGFRALKPTIQFIVKRGESLPASRDPQAWWLLRSDIDTW